MLASAQATLSSMDRMRRRAGQALDAVGAGPQSTPSDVLLEMPGARLRAYPGGPPAGPAVLLVPAPIKRSYIFDLAPQVSVVARCLRHGLRVFLVEWTDVGPAEDGLGIDDYADRMLRACLDEIRRPPGSGPVLLVGHSLGGTLSAICAARHPALVSGLVLLEAPLTFGPRAGAFAALVASAPPTRRLWAGAGVPGTFLNLASVLAAPRSFVLERYADLGLSTLDPSALRISLQVQRWTLDEFRLPGKLFEDVVEKLYRRDDFFSGRLRVGGADVGPRSLRAPMLNVVNPGSRVIPAESVLPFAQAAGGGPHEVLEYRGEVGVGLQHVGVLVGRQAHRELWPRIMDWIDHV